MLKALFFNYDLKTAVSEPRLHNQLSPNTTVVEPGFDKVSLGRRACVRLVVRVLNTVPFHPEHRGRLGPEEPPDGVSGVVGGRGAGGGSLRQRAPRSVGPPQVGLRVWLLRSHTLLWSPCEAEAAPTATAVRLTERRRWPPSGFRHARGDSESTVSNLFLAAASGRVCLF